MGDTEQETINALVDMHEYTLNELDDILGAWAKVLEVSEYEVPNMVMDVMWKVKALFEELQERSVEAHI